MLVCHFLTTYTSILHCHSVVFNLRQHFPIKMNELSNPRYILVHSHMCTIWYRHNQFIMLANIKAKQQQMNLSVYLPKVFSLTSAKRAKYSMLFQPAIVVYIILLY